MKKTICFIFAISALFFASCRIPNQNDAFEKINIGVILPFSGPDAQQGRAMLDGIELAVEEINRRGGIDSRQIQLNIRNSGGDPAKAAKLAEDMIDEDNVVALLGAYSSDEALQLKFVAEKKMVPYVSAMATHESLTRYAEYTFQCTVNDEIQGAALAYYIAYKRNFVKLAVMISTDKNNLYLRGIGHRTAQTWADFAKRKPLLMSYSSEQKSFAEQIKKCIYEDVDVIVLPAYPECALRFIKEAREIGYRGAFAGVDSYDSPVLTAAKINLGDCFFTTPYYAGNKSDANEKFKKLMLKKYNRQPGYAEAKGYDSVNYIAKACNDAFSPGAVADNLRNMRSFYSVSGVMEYHNVKNIMLHPVFVMTCIRDGVRPVNSWTVDVQKLKNYRNREKD